LKKLTQDSIDRFNPKRIPEGRSYIELYDKQIGELSVRLGRRTKTFYATLPATKESRKKRIKIGSANELNLKSARIKTLELLDTNEHLNQEHSNTTLRHYIINVYLKDKDEKSALNRINLDYELFSKKLTSIKSYHIKDWIHQRKNTFVTKGYIEKGIKKICTTDKLISFSTVKREYNIVRAAFFYALEREHISINPASRIKISGDDSVTRKPIPQKVYKEYQNLIGGLPNAHLKLYLAILLYTGARPKEALTIKKRNIDYLNHRIIVPASFSKTAKTRYLIMPEDLMRFFTDFFNSVAHKATQDRDDDWLFYNAETGTRFKSFSSAYKRTIKSAGLPYYSLYYFRHTFASMLANKGVNLVSIMKLLGHTNITTTQKYMQSFDETEVKAVNDFADEVDLW
jgi:integrase